MQQPKKRWTLPLALGLITALLLVAVLWPKTPPRRTVSVAARDLGAGQTLAAADLTTVELASDQAPADALADPAQLVGQTLAVVRFAGEPVTARHLGQAMSLGPYERGIAIQVKADTGLAGLLRPGMQVGVIATLRATTGQAPATDRTGAVLPTLQGDTTYAKAVLEGLRVLYVSPDFQARPYTPATASGAVSGGATDASTQTTSSGSSGTVREGVLVLAAGTQPVTVTYTLTPPVAPTLPLTGTLETAVAAAAPAAALALDPVVTFVPVELLAALNAAGASLTLTLLPEAPQAYHTAGLTIDRLLAPAVPEARR